MIHQNGPDSSSRVPIRFVPLNAPMLCVYAFVFARRAAFTLFFPTPSSAWPLADAHGKRKQLDPDLPLARTGIRLITRQSHCHGDGLAGRLGSDGQEDAVC